jgi:hypothetical protein
MSRKIKRQKADEIIANLAAIKQLEVPELRRRMALEAIEKQQAIEKKAALILVEKGMATVSEAAALRGVSRQAMHELTQESDVRQKRRDYLGTMWTRLLNRLTA